MAGAARGHLRAVVLPPQQLRLAMLAAMRKGPRDQLGNRRRLRVARKERQGQNHLPGFILYDHYQGRIVVPALFSQLPDCALGMRKCRRNIRQDARRDTAGGGLGRRPASRPEVSEVPVSWRSRVLSRWPRGAARASRTRLSEGARRSRPRRGGRAQAGLREDRHAVCCLRCRHRRAHRDNLSYPAMKSPSHPHAVRRAVGRAQRLHFLRELMTVK
jgi:hypothetical protein